ncbi:hypothetical protein EPUS_03323 [Endocarpon pusillum Z07020]|uniref:EKC/KEOPS complex subunit BUD32 n=1 Tax=Endocarpon pusillum (strain Z07020 / HMAS-L-300199) TaxID=1263415 RepID=U1GFZ9_ENDPU|nr:uncharacterized protein EPUS_03323 [Endocarpon pusillum Z07020]ERF71043.1 hypothetical protein EPUS_03323 [Endocarpon pusillum Z07020]
MSMEIQRPYVLPSSRPCWLTDDLEYKYIEELGQGDFAIVYKAKEIKKGKKEGRLLAVKIYKMKVKHQDIDEKILEVKKEAMLMHRIQGGPHILKVGNFRHVRRQQSGTLELPMDYYENTLQHLMNRTIDERGLVSEDTLVIPPWYRTVLTQMLEALEYLHSKDVMVVHRDITPQNILYTKVDNFVLAGFSVARFGRPESETFGGTLKYLAPEMYAEASEVTTAVDVWSLGVLCLDILWLVPPVCGEPAHDLMEEKTWLADLCQIAKEANKPEIAMMVVMNDHERSTAAAVLRFVRTSPSARVQRYPPSSELLHSFRRAAMRTINAVETNQNAMTFSSTSTSTRTREIGRAQSWRSPPVRSARGTGESAGPSDAAVPLRKIVNEQQMRSQLGPEIWRQLERNVGKDGLKELARLISIGMQDCFTAQNYSLHPSGPEDQRSPRHAGVQSQQKEKRTTQAPVAPDAPLSRLAGPPNLRGESKAEQTPSQALSRQEARGQPRQAMSQRPPSELPYRPQAQNQQQQAKAKESASESSGSTAASTQKGKNQSEETLHKPTRRPQAGSKPGEVKAEKPNVPSSDRQKSTRKQEETKGKGASSSPSSS